MNAPKLRFKGYKEPWEQKSLDNLVTFYDKQRKPLKESDRIVGEYPYYGASGIIGYVNNYIFEGEYLLLSEDGANIITRKRPIVYRTKDKFWLNNHAHIFKAKDSIEQNFLYHYLEKINYLPYNSGTAQPKLNLESVKSIPINIPSQEEQKKTATLFEMLSEKAQLQKEKIDLLKIQKKSFMQMIFNQKIRFKNHFGDWKNRTVNDVASLINGRAYKKEELLASGKYPVLRVGNFFTNDSWYYSDLELEQDKYANEGDLLYAWSASFGPKIWKEKKAIYHYHIWKVIINEKMITQDFLYHWFNYDVTRILSQKNGTTMVHVTKSNMENRNILVPSLEEQKIIGDFLNALDNKINYNKEKLKYLEQQKHALMQKMFI
jgi:type I restriction enzyme, S subunit